MPRYDRRCQRCGHTFETVERMHATRAMICPACSERAAVRLPSTPALRTDTSIPECVRRGAAIAGHRIETRADLAAMRARGVDFCSERDMDLCDRKRGKRATEELERVIAEDLAPERVEIRSAPPAKRKGKRRAGSRA